MEATNEGVPLRVEINGSWQVVFLIRRPWRIDQHWWRGEVVRRNYYRVAYEDGPPLTLYCDLVNGGWFRQEYG